jgi:hypothetical protein
MLAGKPYKPLTGLLRSLPEDLEVGLQGGKEAMEAKEAEEAKVAKKNKTNLTKETKQPKGALAILWKFIEKHASCDGS